MAALKDCLFVHDSKLRGYPIPSSLVIYLVPNRVPTPRFLRSSYQAYFLPNKLNFLFSLLFLFIFFSFRVCCFSRGPLQLGSNPGSTFGSVTFQTNCKHRVCFSCQSSPAHTERSYLYLLCIFFSIFQLLFMAQGINVWDGAPHNSLFLRPKRKKIFLDDFFFRG